VDGEISFTSDAALTVGGYVDVLITDHEGADLSGKHEI
jgi:hypothetical protein